MIVVAVSFTDKDLHPLNAATLLAQRLHEPILLVHVLQPSNDVAMGDRRTEALQQLVQLARTVERPDVNVHPELLDGDVVEALHDCVSRRRPRFVVLGGREGEKYQGTNHVAERLSRLLPCPCLVSGRDGNLVRHPSAEKRLRALVALDRTAASDVALEHLAHLRESMAFDCDVVSFYWPPHEQRRLKLPSHAIFGPDSDISTSIADELRARVAALPGTGDVSVQAIPIVGAIGTHILDEARTRGADFILIGSHQRGVLGELIHGSVTQQLLRDATLPVMFAPLSGRGPHGATSEPRRVLVLTDLTDFGNRALAYAYVYFRNTGGVVDLVHVLTPESQARLQRGVDHSLHGLASSRELAISMLQTLVPQFAEPYEIRSQIHVLDGVDVASSIAEHVKQTKPDAICLASHGAGAVRGALAGSVVTSIVHHIDRPVLVVR